MRVSYFLLCLRPDYLLRRNFLGALQKIEFKAS